MRTLRSVAPSREQLKIFSRTKAGVEIIRGAAGSGKTTTALLRLKSQIGLFLARRKRETDSRPVRVLVLTYNRTLRGYIDALTEEQAAHYSGVNLQIETFGRWAMGALGNPRVVDDIERKNTLMVLAKNLRQPSEFIVNEAEYVMERFLPSELDRYISARRDGRGASPRMDRQHRQTLINEVIVPYQDWKLKRGGLDWNDLATQLIKSKIPTPYDVIVADEAQDFSANQVRAIANQLAPDYCLTFVLDSAQRIYARGFTWHEVGITMRPEQIHHLKENFRNTIEIAQLAASLISDLPIDDDGTIPDFTSCTRHGPVPLVLRGKFNTQLDAAIDYVEKEVKLADESVVFLHPLGWFGQLKRALNRSGLPFVEITRRSEWPQGSENIALSTFHSAKGLEFDHVIILGLNAEVTPHGDEEDDDRLIVLRKLVAMGIGRARLSVVIGYKPEEASKLITYLDPSTYRAIDL